jgi:hypothetical protein
MHLLLLIFKFRPHLELEWLCVSVGTLIAAGVETSTVTIAIAIVAALVTISQAYFSFQTAKLKASLAVTASTVVEVQKGVTESIKAAASTERAVLEGNVKVDDLKLHINSRMDKVIEALEAAALARGIKQGGDEERQRRMTQDSDRAKGDIVGRQAERDLVTERNKPVEDPHK